MRKRLGSCVSALALIYAAFCLNPGHGAAQNADTPGRAPETLGLATLTVTAQKQEENPQDIPMGITVMDGSGIEDRMIDSVGDIADFVPNLIIHDNGVGGMNAPSMRGIHAPVQTFCVSTGMYIDGVPVLMGMGFEDNILDIERIEVLRGPQGTLYGKNTEAGAINIITRMPDNQFRGRVSVKGGRLLSAAAGNKRSTQGSIAVSGPIAEDTLYYAFAGQYRNRSGYIENTFKGKDANDLERWYGRGHLRWTPSDRLGVSFLASRYAYDDGDPHMGLGKNGAASFGFPPPEDRQVASGISGKNTSRANALSMKIRYDVSQALTLTSITAGREYLDRGLGDYDFSPARLMHSDKDSRYRKLSQELRLGYAKERFKWLFGIYYDRDRNDSTYQVLSDIPAMAFPTDRNIQGSAYSLFGHLSYPLTNRLGLVAGLRFENQDQEMKDEISGRRVEDSWDALTPKIAMEYRLAPHIMTYASASKGYRSGGFNTFAQDDRYTSYDDEQLWSYELGIKTSLWDDRVVLNTSVYYMDVSDMQVEESVSGVEVYMTNAAEATSKGIELELNARITNELSLFGSFGYTDIEFDTFTDALGDYRGNRVPYAPEYTFSLGAQYRHASGFYARADLIGYGNMLLDKANKSTQDAYQIVNAKLGYETDRFDLYVYGKNIFDKTHNAYGYNKGFYTIYSEPGEAGVELVYRF